MIADSHYYCSIQLFKILPFNYPKYVAKYIVGKLSILASLKRRTQYTDQVVLPSGISEAVLEPRN